MLFFPPSVVFPYPVLKTLVQHLPLKITLFIYFTLAKLQRLLVSEFQTIFQILLQFPCDHSLYSVKKVSRGTWYLDEVLRDIRTSVRILAGEDFSSPNLYRLVLEHAQASRLWLFGLFLRV